MCVSNLKVSHTGTTKALSFLMTKELFTNKLPRRTENLTSGLKFHTGTIGNKFQETRKSQGKNIELKEAIN